MKRKISGFGLVEFIVVILIIGILVILAIWQFNKLYETSKLARAQKHAVELTGMISRYEIVTGKNIQSLKELKNAGDDYFVGELIDPWGAPYFIDESSGDIRVTSSNLIIKLNEQAVINNPIKSP